MRVLKLSKLFNKFQGIYLFLILIILAIPLIPRESTKKLLRVWPAYRPEECDWAIRKFICLRCLKNGYLYAQEIQFDSESRPYRNHGCYSETKGFFPIEEGRDHPVNF